MSKFTTVFSKTLSREMLVGCSFKCIQVVTKVNYFAPAVDDIKLLYVIYIIYRCPLSEVRYLQ